MSAFAVLVATLGVALMGLAIQRGATCAVAAVDELLGRRRGQRLQAMFEASLWVAATLVLVRSLQPALVMPAGHAVGWGTVLGAVLLGLGAWINGACVFGAIARLGSGHWAYAATPPGFLLGCAAVQPWLGQWVPPALDRPSPVLDAPPLLAAAWIALGCWRLLRERAWSPRMATWVIGIAFVVVLLLAGPWTYTDWLAELARGQAMDTPTRALLFAALLAGAVAGGWSSGRWQPQRPAARQLARCLAGGAAMGAGGALIPGSNDGLILVGMPLAQPAAWLAFAIMIAVIAAAMLAARRINV